MNFRTLVTLLAFAAAAVLVLLLTRCLGSGSPVVRSGGSLEPIGGATVVVSSLHGGALEIVVRATNARGEVVFDDARMAALTVDAPGHVRSWGAFDLGFDHEITLERGGTLELAFQDASGPARPA